MIAQPATPGGAAAKPLTKEKMEELDQNREDPDEAPMRPLARGIEVIRQQLRTMPAVPGVYRMLDERGTVLYVGKAKNLKARLTSYTIAGNLSQRIMRMVALTRSLVVVTTHTEVEALLLEANLIKRFRPHYNILL